MVPISATPSIAVTRSPWRTPALSLGPSDATRPTTSLPSNSRRLMPSQGRDGADLGDPVDRGYPIAVADPRLVTWTVRRDAADDELAIQLAQIDAEPRP